MNLKPPNNGIMLGIEQLVMELNGWKGKIANAIKPMLSNKISATANEIYKAKALKWLDKHYPNWRTEWKFDNFDR